jgi:hypothetical protein
LTIRVGAGASPHCIIGSGSAKNNAVVYTVLYIITRFWKILFTVFLVTFRNEVWSDKNVFFSSHKAEKVVSFCRLLMENAHRILK